MQYPCSSIAVPFLMQINIDRKRERLAGAFSATWEMFKKRPGPSLRPPYHTPHTLKGFFSSRGYTAIEGIDMQMPDKNRPARIFLPDKKPMHLVGSINYEVVYGHTHTHLNNIFRTIKTNAKLENTFQP